MAYRIKILSVEPSHAKIQICGKSDPKLNAQEVKFTSAINWEKEKFDGLKTQAADLDQNKLTATRHALRQQMENEAKEALI